MLFIESLTLKNDVKALVGPATPRAFRRLARGAGAGAGSFAAPSSVVAAARLPLTIVLVTDCELAESTMFTPLLYDPFYCQVSAHTHSRSIHAIHLRH